MRQSVAISAGGSLICLAGACTDPIVGDWDLVRVEGDTYPLNDGSRIYLDVDDDLNAEIVSGGPGSGDDVFTGEVEVSRRNQSYEIRMVDFNSLQCDLLNDDEFLDCRDGFSQVWVWQRDRW